jgi:hypothetical protein
MKLHDFYGDEILCSLRERMNAPLPTGNIFKREISLLSEDEVRRLGIEGIDVDLGEIKVESDGTLSLKGKRVTVYIRDVAIYQEKYELPRFHLSYCTTLESKSKKNQFNLRYVSSQNDSGKFSINYIRRNNIESKMESLFVCMHCLDNIEWKNFSHNRSNHALRKKIVQEFDVKEFYQKYPKDLISVLPTFTSDNSPINNYSSNWPEIRIKIINKRDNKCEKCSSSSRLEVHHKNGVKNDNTESNLEVLCHYHHTLEHPHYK